MPKPPTDPASELIKAATEPLTENAKAVQETAKAVQKGLDVAKGMGGFIERIIGPAADELGHTLRDRASLLRINTRNKILLDIEARIAKREIHPEALRVLPFADAVRFIESASIESDSEAQDLWARLVTNAVDGETNVSIKKIYIDLLNSLSAPEVFFLELLWKIELMNPKSVEDIKSVKSKIEAYADEKWRKVKTEDADIAIQNLTRLRCVSIISRYGDYYNMFKSIRDGHQWSAVDPSKLVNLLNSLIDISNYNSGAVSKVKPVPNPRGLASYVSYTGLDETKYALTSVGRDLMRACHEDRPV